MASAGSESLFRAAESAAPAEDRIMPTQRVYKSNYGTVSLEEAIALMKRRRSNPDLIIKGGLDDNSDAVRVDSVDSSNIIDKPKKSSKRGRKPGVKSASKSRNSGNSSKTLTELLTDLSSPGTPESDGLIADLAPTPDGISMKEPDGPLAGFVGPTELIAEPNTDLNTASDTKAIKALKRSIDKQTEVLTKLAESCSEVIEQSSSKADEPSSTAILDQFKSTVNKVTFLTKGLKFTIKCLSMIMDTSKHVLVLAFKDSEDTFFTPEMQSEVEIEFNDKKVPGKLYYFGMDFSLKMLDLRFLGFVYDDNATDKLDK